MYTKCHVNLFMQTKETFNIALFYLNNKLVVENIRLYWLAFMFMHILL